MKIIGSSIQMLDELNESNILKRLEQIGRTCYKSENKITDDSCVNFVRKIIKNGHHAIIEHVSISVKVICDRGVSHEIVRHRIASYAQECVSGDTLVRSGLKKIKIKDLYDRKYGSCYDKTHNKTIHLRSVNEKTREVIPNKMIDIFYKGKQEVFEIITKLGYRLKCTMAHKFLTRAGYKKLEELSVGDFVFINGRACLLNLNNKELKRLYLQDGLNCKEISDITDAPISSIRRRLKQMNIFQKHLNDKNLEKYNKNHTCASYKKMVRTIRKQYKQGRVVWNKGITGKNSHSYGVDRGNRWRKKMSMVTKGKRNSNWKGGISRRICIRKKIDIKKCELCFSEIKLEVHHKDGNHKNNKKVNLIKVCWKCYNLLHHGWHVGTRIVLDEIVSIEYAGTEGVYDMEMQLPFQNYIANGFVTHNSTRYCNYGEDKFSNEITVIEPCFIGENVKIYSYWLDAMFNAEQSYMGLLELGCTPQEARSVLPNSLKTEIVMTMNLREWRYFLTLRTAKAAHPQMREVAGMILNEFKARLPIIFEDIKEESI